jgi:hypothetical protein
MNTVTETVASPVPAKFKVQKRTPTERQLEALEKARLAKQKKGIITELRAEQSPFLVPSPYLVGTILLGLGGLAAYSWLKPVENSSGLAKVSRQMEPIELEPTPVPITTECPKPREDKKTQDFFNGSMKI